MLEGEHRWRNHALRRPAATMSETDRLGGSNIWKVIAASGVGTMIEWYDFYIFGSLALVMATRSSRGKPDLAVLSTLATFAAGFAVRPFGALFFGRIGDLVGRKYAFLVTLVIMGGATFVIGLLPTYAQIGMLAPIILVLLRLLRDSPSAANTAARRSTSPSTCRTSAAASTRASSRPRPPSAFVSLGVILIVQRRCRRRTSRPGAGACRSCLDPAGGDVALHPPALAGVAALRAP